MKQKEEEGRSTKQLTSMDHRTKSCQGTLEKFRTRLRGGPNERLLLEVLFLETSSLPSEWAKSEGRQRTESILSK